MPDPSEQLQRLYLAGFEFQTFDLFPNAVGVVRGDCIVMVLPLPSGLQMIGTPGWRVGESIGVLTEQNGRKIFQNKSEILEATAERLELLAAFRRDIEQALASQA